MTSPTELARAWQDTLPGAEQLGDDLLRRWAEPWRHYHDVEHLAEVLSALDDLVSPAPRPVRLAAWFHDAVYDPRGTDNEERSAELAASLLPATGLDATELTEVTRLVRLTATHDADPDDVPGQLLCDADLAILGSSPPRYARYVDAVRREYAHVPEPEFRAARDRILRGFLDRPAIYRIEAGRTRWESAARRNLTTEIAGDADRRP